MRLYEYEGKRLLARYGVNVPRGELWSRNGGVPDTPVAVKAQMLEGGRGKRGGIRFTSGEAETMSTIESLQRGSLELPPVDTLLIEEQLNIESELYLALLLDRELRAPLLLASSEGGVEIESVRGDRIVRIPLDPELGIQEPVAEDVASALGLSSRRSEIASLLTAMWDLFVNEDCMLLEVNPLVLTREGRLVAADARIILDSNARWRHTDWPEAREGSLLERRCAGLGAVAAEMDGRVAIVTSGAGLGMATVDTVVALGGDVRCFVDLGGTVFGGPDVLADIIDEVRVSQPDVLLFNSYFQFARCDTLALGIARSHERMGFDCPAIARLRGNNEREAADLLVPLGLTVTGDMEEACRIAVGSLDIN